MPYELLVRRGDLSNGSHYTVRGIMEHSGGRIEPCVVQTTMTAGLFLAAALLAGSQQAVASGTPADASDAQKPAAAAPAGSDDSVGELPVSIQRIQRALSRPPAI